MAKDNQPEIKNEVEKEHFILTDKTRDNGYVCTSKDLTILIDFEKDYKWNRIDRYASTGTYVNGKFKSDNVDYLTGLNLYQVYLLATAGVIKVKKSQRHHYANYLKSIKRVEEDD